MQRSGDVGSRCALSLLRETDPGLEALSKQPRWVCSSDEAGKRIDAGKYDSKIVYHVWYREVGSLDFARENPPPGRASLFVLVMRACLC